MNWNNILIWVAIVVLFFLVLRPIGKISNYEGSNTIFDLNELSWLPSEVKTKLKNGINDRIIPQMKTSIDTFWNGLTPQEKTTFLNSIDQYMSETITNIQNNPPTKENIMRMFSSNDNIIGSMCNKGYTQ